MNWLKLILISLIFVSFGCKEQSSRAGQQKKISVSAGQIGSLLPSFATVDWS
jgi:hypothetical protein